MRNVDFFFHFTSVRIPFPDETNVYLNPSLKSGTINDCRRNLDAGPATPSDFDKLNVVWVEVRYKGLIYVFEVITQDLEPNSELLTYYGDT